jgi:hypothetical protein
MLLEAHPFIHISRIWVKILYYSSWKKKSSSIFYVVHKCNYGPGVDSASNRNEYQEYFLGVKAAGA